MRLQQRFWKEEEGGCAESSLSFSAEHWFLWEQDGLCAGTSHSPALGGTSSSIPALYLCGQLFFCLIHSSCPCLCPATTPITTDTKRKENSQPLGRIKSPYKSIQATGSQCAARESHAHPSISCLISYSLLPPQPPRTSIPLLFYEQHTSFLSSKLRFQA